MILEYQDLIFSICYKFTANYFDAEDLAQDTFLAAYKNYASFDGANERAWLCRIATNKSLDYLKRAGRRSVPTEDVYFSGLSAEGASLEDDVMDRGSPEAALGMLQPVKIPLQGGRHRLLLPRDGDRRYREEDREEHKNPADPDLPGQRNAEAALRKGGFII